MYYSDKKWGRHFHWSRDCPLTGPEYQRTTEEEILDRGLNPCSCILKELTDLQRDYLETLPLPISGSERKYILGCLDPPKR